MKTTGLKCLIRASACRVLGGLSVALTSPAVIFASVAEPVVGRIADWPVSEPVRVSNIDLERYPDAGTGAALQWTSITSDPAGRIEVTRYCKSLGGGGTRVFIRTTLPAARREMLCRALGFSESVSLYLNGRTVFRRRNPAPPADAEALAADHIFWLELEAGDNDLMLALSRVSATWGFVARDLDAVFQCPGLTKLWEITTGLRAPESVAGDPVRRVLYVANFAGDCISKLSFDGTILDPEWARGLKRPTGLKLFHGVLYAVERTGVAVIDPETGAIKSVDLATKHIENFTVLGPPALMDGLVSDGAGGYLFSDYFGRIFRADAAGSATLLLDRTGPRQFCADFDYLPEERMLVVPSLYDQRLTAYGLRLDEALAPAAQERPPRPAGGRREFRQAMMGSRPLL